MNLKFSTIGCGMCFFGSALSMFDSNSSGPMIEVGYPHWMGSPGLKNTIKYDAQFIHYTQPQNEAMASFVRTVGKAWEVEAARKIELRERSENFPSRTMSTYGIPYSKDGHDYYSSFYVLDASPDRRRYEDCVEAQLRMGILDLPSLIRVNRPSEPWLGGKRVAIPTPRIMIDLLPDLIKTLGIRVYPENYVAWYNSQQGTAATE